MSVEYQVIATNKMMTSNRELSRRVSMRFEEDVEEIS